MIFCIISYCLLADTDIVYITPHNTHTFRKIFNFLFFFRKCRKRERYISGEIFLKTNIFSVSQKGIFHRIENYFLYSDLVSIQRWERMHRFHEFFSQSFKIRTEKLLQSSRTFFPLLKYLWLLRGSGKY